MAYLRERVRLLQSYQKLNNDWSVRDLKNRALSERIALLKELKAVGDLEMTERQIRDRVQAIRDIRFRQQQKAEQAKRNAKVASIQAYLEESDVDTEETEVDDMEESAMSPMSKSSRRKQILAGQKHDRSVGLRGINYETVGQEPKSFRSRQKSNNYETSGSRLEST